MGIKSLTEIPYLIVLYIQMASARPYRKIGVNKEKLRVSKGL